MRATMGWALALAAMAPMLGAAAIDTDLQQSLTAPTRAPKNVARDAVRHPGEELAFFGLRPDANVVEIWPGSGYWTEILAPYLIGRGTYTVALPDSAKYAAPMVAKLRNAPQFYRKVKITTLGHGRTDIALPGSVDLIVTFRNLHNWMEAGTTQEFLAAFYKALKPGGILGVEDHRGDPNKPQDPKAENGYVRQDVAIKTIEAAGFKFVGSSEINANPRDTKDYKQGVWTLPPTYALGETDRAKYAAIGEADNFVLKFQKPPTSP